MNRTRRFVLLGFALALICAEACGCLPYVYPKVDYLHSYNPGVDGSGYHVFRVEYAAHQMENGSDHGKYIITELAAGIDGSFPWQLNVSLERKSFILLSGLIPAKSEVGVTHVTLLRLYRPGYRLVELSPGDSTDRHDVPWQPADNWWEQEEALEALLRRPAIDGSGSVSVDVATPAPSMHSGLHRTKALDLFAMAEFDRIAALADPPNAARLRDKANYFRKTPTLPTSPTPTAATAPATPVSP